LIIGCWVFTSLPKLPSGIPRLPIATLQKSLQMEGSITSLLLKIANPSSPLMDAIFHDFLDALFSTSALSTMTAPCKALALASSCEML